MSQEGQEFVCAGALCRCDQGSTPSPLQVTSQQNVYLQGKLLATSLDKTFGPFGTCALKNNQACVPALLLWEQVRDSVSIGQAGGKALLEKSTIRCAVGGVVRILNTLQIQVPAPPPAAHAEESRTGFLMLAPVALLPTPNDTTTSPLTDDA